MNYEQALNWVHSLPRLAAHPGVENTKRLLAALGHPERELKFVHVAGTNGKGSTTVMLSSVLRAAGYKTGATISPYVLDFRERFQIDGAMIAPDVLADILTQVRMAAERISAEGWNSLVEFDAVTAAALLWFAQQKCDIVCMETGLGGRLDSTNAVENTLVAAIMKIGLDHTELLGNTVGKIATEKCGILKNHCTVVCYPCQPPEAMAEIALCAEAAGCSLVVPKIGDVHTGQGHGFENSIDYKEYKLQVPFPGLHQGYNAAVVVEVALALREKGFAIPKAAIQKGICEAAFPARIEMLSRAPLVILDGAHNTDGMEALAQTLEQAGVGQLTAVVGILEGKGAAQMLEILRPFVRTVYTVTPDSPRAIPAEALASMARGLFSQVHSCADVGQAILAAQRENSGMLICGSLYLAAQARKYFRP